MKKQLSWWIFLGAIFLVGCSQSQPSITKESKPIKPTTIISSPQEVKNTSAIDKSAWQTDPNLKYSVNFPADWYYYSLDTGPLSTIDYFTDGGNFIKTNDEETRMALLSRSHDSFTDTDECLMTVTGGLFIEDNEISEINSKISAADKITCDNILSELEKQVPLKNEYAVEHNQKEKEIETKTKSYTGLDNCGVYYKDELEKKVYYVKALMYDRELVQIEAADYANFEVVAECIVAKDKFNVYSGEQIVVDADSVTFKHTPTAENPYAFEDKNHKYNCSETCKIID